MSQSVQVNAFLDAQTETWSYVVYDKNSAKAAIIDPVLELDYSSGRTSTEGADKIIAFIQQQQLSLEWILETHAHADHLSSAPYIRARLGGKIAIGGNITLVQETFKNIFNLTDLALDGSQFDHLFADGERFQLGDIECSVMLTPGHTPACMTWIIGDAVFVGDTLFMPDVGTARCDFPGGDAKTLYRSTQKILAMPDDTKLYMCHDYPPAGRDYQYLSTVAEQKLNNIHVRQGISEQEFVAMREARDATLAMPRLIIPSIQVNVRAGEMPAAEDNGTVYLKLPINTLK